MNRPPEPLPAPDPQLGQRVRAARKEKGLSIRAAAEMLRCSPRFVHQLELGKPTARMDKVQQVLSGLGLRLSVQGDAGPQPRADARIEARAKQNLYEERLARAHDRIAAALALGQFGAAEIGRARSQVRKWEEHSLCSRWYIDRWRAILHGTGRQVAANLLAMGKEDARALFQNTPFGFLVRDFLRA